ncbi:MAG: hypothetical protein Q4A44_00570 [Bacteroidales bacterium]|nr:hypothetical protein [Bacteroidales bacterium]
MKQIALMLLLTLVSCNGYEVKVDLHKVEENRAYTMTDLFSISCDSFYVVTPYVSGRLDSAAFDCPKQIKKVATHNAYASSEDKATIVFVQKDKAIGYATIQWCRDSGFVPPLKGLKGYAMNTRVQINEHKCLMLSEGTNDGV